MTVRITKPEFNIREKLSELDIPVGNHGTQLMKSSDVAETHNLLQLKNRRKNYFINGDCRIWQRGTSNPNLNNYGCDRWWKANGATQMDRSTDVPAYNTTGAEAFTYSMKVTSNGTGSNIGQPIELIDTGVSQFGNGKQYTLSFYAKTDSGTGDVSVVMYYRNSKFSSTNQVNWEPNHAPHLGTMNRGWQRFVYTFTAPAVNANNTMLAFELSFNVTTYFTGFQLEEGPQVTPFEFTNEAEELALCYRYYRRFSPYSPTGTDNYCGYGVGVINQSGGGIWTFPLDIPMRDRPTIRQNNLRIYDGSGNQNITAMNTNRSSQTSIWVEPTTGTSSFTIGRAFLIGGNNTAGGYVELDAEL